MISNKGRETEAGVTWGRFSVLAFVIARKSYNKHRE